MSDSRLLPILLALVVLPAAARAQILPSKAGSRAAAAVAVPAPQNVTALSTPAGVQLSWSAVPVAAQYEVLRAANATTPGTAVGTVGAGTLGFVDRGFVAAASYQVVAVAADGRRGVSSTVSVAAQAPVKTALRDMTARVALPAKTAPTGPPPAPPAGISGHEIVTTGPVLGAVNGGYYQVVNCPTGKQVVGGGVRLNSGQIEPWNSQGPSGNNAWVVAARTASSVPALAFFSAVCISAPAALGYEIVTAGPVVGAVNGGYYQVVNCPTGKQVVGGGMRLNSGQIESWSTNGPSGNNAWAVAGRTRSSEPASAWFFAICLSAPAAPGYEIVAVGPVVGAVNGGFYQVVSCPSGKKVVGGGVRLNSGQIESWSSNGPSGNNAWVVAGRTASSTPASAWFFAICLSAS